MHVLCCPDSFKGTATAAEAADALAEGARDAGATAAALPLADGGEGTAEILARALDPAARPHAVATVDAMGRPTTAFWWDGRPGEAILDLASASGLPAVADVLDAPAATTRGTGLVIADALAHGRTHLTVCLGGSATTDGGRGIVEELDDVPEHLTWTLITDVTTTAAQAATVFGPQKGATPAQVRELTDRLLAWCADCGVDPLSPGYGAAGATPVGITTLARRTGGSVRLRPGAAHVAEVTGLTAAIAAADLVITGEGSVDSQSEQGKIVGKVAELAAGRGTPYAVVGGRVDDALGVVKHAAFAVTLDAPMDQTIPALRRAGKRVVAGLR